MYYMHSSRGHSYILFSLFLYFCAHTNSAQWDQSSDCDLLFILHISANGGEDLFVLFFLGEIGRGGDGKTQHLFFWQLAITVGLDEIVCMGPDL